MASIPNYNTRIVPALREIQSRFGFLRREFLEQFAKESGLPLHRLHAVASFFPHFRFEPPAPVTIRVCRDMACHLAGSAELIRSLNAQGDERVHVEGVSCLGRCDRAPAACVSVCHAGTAGAPEEHEDNYLGRTAENFSEIVQNAIGFCDGKRAGLSQADYDIDLPVATAGWLIDPYAKSASEKYAGVRKAVAARTAGIDSAAAALRAAKGWSDERADLFAIAAARRLQVDFPLDDDLLDAVVAWQTNADWAEGDTLGNWSESLLTQLDDAHADLRGLGGAGIPATQKWRDVRDAIRTNRRRRKDDRGFIVVNGDESEPGTFKDRELLLRTPHLIIEAVIIAGVITDATEGFIYIRHEYHEQIEACREAIREAEGLGMCGLNASVLGRPFRVSVFVSPGGYICGEQSALIEAMSDRRGEPRNMPPKLETNGLDDQPTLVSNVETFAWVPYNLLNGGRAYADLGVNGCRGRRFFSVSGDVKRPGVYEVPMGMTLRELILGENYCAGIRGDLALKAIAPSGPSGGFLPARLTGRGLPRDHTKNKTWLELAARRGFDPQATSLDVLDLELALNTFRALSPTQALGAGIVVYAADRDMAAEAVNSIEFYRNESCGKCVPCRIGSQKMANLGANMLAGAISAERWKTELEPTVRDLGKVMEQSSICGLGRSVPVPLKTVMDFFPDDLAAHLAKANGLVTPAKEATR